MIYLNFGSNPFFFTGPSRLYRGALWMAASQVMLWLPQYCLGRQLISKHGLSGMFIENIKLPTQ